jgi:hypothetical protein
MANVEINIKEIVKIIVLFLIKSPILKFALSLNMPYTIYPTTPTIPGCIERRTVILIHSPF